MPERLKGSLSGGNTDDRVSVFAACAEARFEITDIVADADIAYLRWEFVFRLPRERRAGPPVEGVSRVRFAADGRVSEHVDYWDAAGQLYTRLPVIGALMRWLRRRAGVGGA